MTAVTNDALVVRKSLEFDAPPERVWAALTEPEQLATWFPDAVEIESVSPGNRGWFVWNEHGRYAFEVVELEAPHHLVWRWARDKETELDDGPTTRVEWQVDARPGGGTVLEVRETGFSSEEYRRGNDEGWDKELGELVELLA